MFYTKQRTGQANKLIDGRIPQNICVTIWLNLETCQQDQHAPFY